LTFPSSTVSREREALLVSIETLEAKGEAPAERALAISSELRALIDSDSDIEVVPVEKVATTAFQYRLKGAIYAGGGRHFVGLQLLEAKTGDLIWSDNYDYTNITTDMMAKDVAIALHAASTAGQRR
jgi:hypothetical protein